MLDFIPAKAAIAMAHFKSAANTTTYFKVNKCDAGIIANVKSLYRKRLLRHVLAQMDETESATELAKRVNVLDAISWPHSAWAGVTEDCVRKCFAKCGFHPVGDALPVEEESGPDDNRPDEQESAPDDNTLVLLGDVEWNDFVGMDDAIHTTAIHNVTGRLPLSLRRMAMPLMMRTAVTKRKARTKRSLLHVQHFLHVMP